MMRAILLSALVATALCESPADKPVWVVELDSGVSEADANAVLEACSAIEGASVDRMIAGQGTPLVLVFDVDEAQLEGVRGMSGVVKVELGGPGSQPTGPIFIVLLHPSATQAQYDVVMEACKEASPVPPEPHLEGGDRMIAVLTPVREAMGEIAKLPGVELVDEIDPEADPEEADLKIYVVEMKREATAGEFKEVLSYCETVSTSEPQTVNTEERRAVGITGVPEEVVEMLRGMPGVREVEEFIPRRESPGKALPSVWLVELRADLPHADADAIAQACAAVNAGGQPPKTVSRDKKQYLAVVGASADAMAAVKDMKGVASLKEDRSVETVFEAAIDQIVAGMDEATREEMLAIKDEKEFQARVMAYLQQLTGDAAKQEEAPEEEEL